ncbi:MAG: hypothetical protein U5N53_17485 [Mycobacterium sp.]|nr:hypothetical protein [Mycobacterium sp.]
MIKYEWRTELDPTEMKELTDLLDRAAEYDGEAEYTSIAAEPVIRSMTERNSRFRHLVIWMLPYATAMGEPDHPERIAGLLRMHIHADGTAQSALVIDPRLRSIGIATLLLERIGLDFTGSEGWLGTGVREVTAWARGNHPAAGRLSNRFLIPRTRRVWKLIRAAAEQSISAATVLDPVSHPGEQAAGWLDDFDTTGTLALREDGRIVGIAALDLRPIISEEFGASATVLRYRAAPSASPRARRGLLDGLAAVAHEAGLSGVIIHVDSDDTRWVNSCRLSGFQHDRTDVRYQLGGPR